MWLSGAWGMERADFYVDNARSLRYNHVRFRQVIHLLPPHSIRAFYEHPKYHSWVSRHKGGQSLVPICGLQSNGGTTEGNNRKTQAIMHIIKMVID